MAKQTKFKIGNNVVEVGKSYYRACYNEPDDEDGTKEHVEIDEFVLRSVKARSFLSAYSAKRVSLGKYAHFTLKLKHVTWIKLSKKHFDWGFTKSIPEWCRKSYNIEDLTSWYDLSPTPAAAIKKEIASIRKVKADPARPWYARYATKEYKAQAIKVLTRKLNSEKKKAAKHG